jgi:copper(I)-binding protein
MKTITKIALSGILAAAGAAHAFAQPTFAPGTPMNGVIMATGTDHTHGTTAAGATGDAVKVGDLEIKDAFSKAMLPGQPVGGGYLTITNTGKADDVLVSAASPAAGVVELHEMAMQGQVMKMRKLDVGIAVPAGQTVELKPGGLHMMFMKVKEPFKAGGEVPVTLTFEKAGQIEVKLVVGAAGPGGHKTN